MYNEYPITCILGDRGWGKTVTMTMLAKKYHDEGLTIFSNYKLIGIPYQHIEFNDIVDFPEYLHDGIILLDEVHIGTDAYAFFTSRVKKITEFATQTRKLRLLMFYSTQVFTQPAKRLRDLTNYIIYCEPDEIKNWFILNIYDRSKVSEDGYVKSIKYNAKPYYSMYDTNEIIKLND